MIQFIQFIKENKILAFCVYLGVLTAFICHSISKNTNFSIEDYSSELKSIESTLGEMKEHLNDIRVNTSQIANR